MVRSRFRCVNLWVILLIVFLPLEKKASRPVFMLTGRTIPRSNLGAGQRLMNLRRI